MRTNHSPSERGQAIILIALAIFGLLALTALAVDGGNAYSERRRAQNAADATVLDAALAKVRGQDLYTEGLARAASNRYEDTNAGAGSSNPSLNVEIYAPPISGPYSGNPEYVQTFITITTPTYFGRVVGIPDVTNRVEAVARARPPVINPMAFGNAVVGLAPEECKAVTYNGSSSVTLIGSGIFVNSNCANSAFFNNSNSPGSNMTAPCLQSVGGITYNPGSLNIPSECLSTGASSWGYPPTNILMPDPTCSGTAHATGNTMSPGNWSGQFPPNNVDHLNPGIYCVSGDFRINGGQTLIGQDVVIRMNSGNISWNGGATVQLDAPNDGPFAGLLIFIPMSNQATVSINGNGASSITGSILAPSSAVSLEGGSGTGGLHTQVVGYTVGFSGSSGISLVYNSAEQYHPPLPPTIELVQ
jgi:Flp pilus assembly protein TadG